MSEQQQRQLDAILRQGQFDTGADVQTLRAAFGELMAQVPVAPDIRQNPVEIGGVSGIEVTIQGNEAQGNEAQGNEAQGNEAQGNEAQGNEAQGNEAEKVILYFHGGVYVIGS